MIFGGAFRDKLIRKILRIFLALSSSSGTKSYYEKEKGIRIERIRAKIAFRTYKKFSKKRQGTS